MAAGRHRDQEGAESRRFLYADVEELIRFGFLGTPIVLGGVTLVIRSLNRTELGVLTHQATGSAAWRRWCVSSSILSVDGWMLQNVPNASATLYHYWVKNLEKSYVNTLMYTFLGLQRRVNRAHTKLEAYCYEPYSRYAWFTKVWENALVRNDLQDSWVAYNEQEDRRDMQSHNWDCSSSIVSSTSQKGGKAVRRHLDDVNEKKNQRETRTIEEAVNFVIHGSKEDPGATVMVRGQKVRIDRIKQANTLSEMEAEMDLVRSGQKDGHDMQVDDYEGAIRDAVQKRQEAARVRQQKQEAMDGLMHQAGIGGATRLVGYSDRQMAEMGSQTPKGVKSTPTSSDAHRLYQRYVEKGTKVGHIGMKGVPEAEAGGDLQSEMQNRTPSFRSEAIGSPNVRKPDAE